MFFVSCLSLSPTRTPLTQDKMASGAIHRSDVAKLVLDALYSKKMTKKIVTAIDPSLANAPATAYTPADV